VDGHVDDMHTRLAQTVLQGRQQVRRAQDLVPVRTMRLRLSESIQPNRAKRGTNKSCALLEESGMKASDLLVKALENEGVEFIFGIPGEENLDFLEALRTSKIKLILTRHEQAAGFMAATYGRLTGKPGVCLSTLGPGATNLVTAAA